METPRRNAPPVTTCLLRARVVVSQVTTDSTIVSFAQDYMRGVAVHS